MRWQPRQAHDGGSAKIEEVERKEPKEVPVTRYRFTGGRIEVRHPFLGDIRLDHLDNGHIIAGIKACDHKGRTTNWWATNIEETS